MSKIEVDIDNLNIPKCCKEALKRINVIKDCSESLEKIVALAPLILIATDSHAVTIGHVVGDESAQAIVKVEDPWVSAVKGVSKIARSRIATEAQLESLSHTSDQRLFRFWKKIADSFSKDPEQRAEQSH